MIKNLPLYAKYLFVLYLTISGNYIGDLFGCRIRDLMNNSVPLKHILAFLTLYFFISLGDSTELSLKTKLLMSSAIYLFFIMSTKLDTGLWLLFIGLLLGVYVLSVINDHIEEYNQLSTETIKYYQYILSIAAFIVLLIGFVAYYGEKKKEYGADFNFGTFLLGKVECKGFTPESAKNVNIFQKISYAFT